MTQEAAAEAAFCFYAFSFVVRSSNLRTNNLYFSFDAISHRRMVSRWEPLDTEADMNLQTYLDENEVHYRVSRHSAVYTAQELAATEHVPGKRVIKPVVVRADGELIMCVLPASYRIDIGELKQQLLADVVELLDEPSLVQLFTDCQPGAEPPIGRLYGMTTLMDESLMHGNQVVFQAGTHEEAVTMSLADYRRVAQAEMAYFGRPGA